jgi:TRAP-type mannitol/chloroaromatic compound transport system substrate-binding protein
MPVDFIGWVYEGGGLELWNEFYQKELKLNLVAIPEHPAEPAGARLVQAARSRTCPTSRA